MDIWLSALETMVTPILTLGVMMAMGVILSRLRILDEQAVDVLTRLLVYLLLPLLMITNVVEGFRPYEAQFKGWLWLPVSALGITAMGYGLGWASHLLFGRRGDNRVGRRITFASLCGWQNAGYITIPIIIALYPEKAQQQEMLVLCFLFILGLSPTLWSIVPLNMMRAGKRGAPSGEASPRLEWKRMITPPFVAIMLSIIVCLLKIPQQIPKETLGKIMTPFDMVGQTAVPIIMVALGAMLAQTRTNAGVGPRFAIGLIGVKEIIMPGLMLAALAAVWGRWGISPGIGAIIFMQTVTPPATAMAVIARRYASRDQSDLVNQAILWSYAAAALLIPLWLTVAQVKLKLFPA